MTLTTVGLIAALAGLPTPADDAARAFITDLREGRPEGEELQTGKRHEVARRKPGGKVPRLGRYGEWSMCFPRLVTVFPARSTQP